VKQQKSAKEYPMGWMGKIIGGTLGFVMGGPIGAVAGAVFGHAFDAGNRALEHGQEEGLSSWETSQMTFFVALFSMLAKLSQADGKVSKEEVRSVEAFMTYDLKLDPQSRIVAMNIFQEALSTPQPFEAYAEQFYQHFRNQPQLLDVMVDILLRISIADGQMSSGEDQMIRSAVNIFNFSEERYAQFRSRYISDTGKYYSILNCSQTDSDEKIKSQYRKLVQEYHPDKIAAKGLPEEFTKFANDKFREIQEAYDMIKKERGIN
jgi:DnaJ like chaperone protein